MRFARLQCLLLALGIFGALGSTAVQAGPIAVIANFTEGFGAGTVAFIDTATDQPVRAPIPVGVNPSGVVITPDGKTAVVACAYTADLYFFDLTAKPPALLGSPVSVSSGSNNTFYPTGLAMSPDGSFVAVTALGVTQDPVTMEPITPQTNIVKVVDVAKRNIEQVLDVSQLPDQGAGTLDAQAAAISGKGAIVLVSPKPSYPVIYALSFADGQIDLPDAANNSGQFKAYGGPNFAQGTNVAITPDGSTAIVPAGRQFLQTFTIDDTAGLTLATTTAGISSGGDGAQSVAITADGKTAYVLNILSGAAHANISAFQIGPGGTLTPAGIKLNADAMPSLLAAYGLPVGNQMLAVTPDGKKIYEVSPYSKKDQLDLTGEVVVFQPDKPDAINRLTVGTQPYAIAIQQK
jgi:DNA-binding beta-propeller fold protein YncE